MTATPNTPPSTGPVMPASPAGGPRAGALTSSTAQLPARYEAAKKALAECANVDECQDWADKMAAIASYARQAEDPTLERYAMRIKSRAIQRGGLLLEQIPAEPQANLLQNRREGVHPSVTRQSAAESAGISEWQRKTMLRVANVPGDQFEALVESDTPPTITQLAEIGKQCRGKATPEEFKYATQALATLRRFAEFARETDANRAAAGVQAKEIAAARENVAAVDRWLDAFICHLGGTEE